MSHSVGRFFTTIMAKILFAVLIVAFGAWGIADMLRSNPNKEAVISVGDVNVTTMQTKRAFMRELQNLRQSFGPQLTVEEAAKFGVFNNVLSQMASRALLDAAAKDMNIGVSDKAMQELIMSNKAFLGNDGKFSRDRFRRTLENNGYTEKDFLSTTRGDMTRQRIIDSVSAPIVAPQFLVDTLLRYEGEQRIVEQYSISTKNMPKPKDPEDTVLKAYQDKFKADYTSPETRKMSVLLISPKNIEKTLKITDEELKAYYKAHLDEFIAPETRELSQILTNTKENAQKIALALRKGTSIKKVAKSTKSTFTNLGWVERTSLLKTISAPSFAAKKGDVLPPIESPLGWHVVIVNDIKPAHQKTYKKAHDAVAKIIKNEKTLTAVYDASVAIEDSIASGATLEEAGELHKISILTLPAVTVTGDSNPDVTAISDIAKAGYDQTEGEQSTLLEYDGEPGGYFIVRTDAITPSALKPFKSVRADLLKKWQASAQEKTALNKAQELNKLITDGKSIKKFVKVNKVQKSTSGPLYRSSQGELPPVLLKDVFDYKIGQAGNAATPDGAIVAKLKSIKPVNLADFKDALAQGKEQLRGTLGNALMAPFTQQLTETYDMKQFRSVDSLVQELK